MPPASTTSLISWTIETVLKPLTVFLGGVDATQWPRAGFLVWGLHRLARSSECGCLRLLGHFLLSWAGLLTGKYLWPQNWQGALQWFGEASGKGDLGKADRQLAHLCKKCLPSRSGVLWQRNGVDGCPVLAQLSFWRGAFPLQVCQLPSTKNTSLKRALLCMQLCREPQLGWQKAVSWGFLCTSGRAQSVVWDHYQKNWDRAAHPASSLFLLPLTQQGV